MWPARTKRCGRPAAQDSSRACRRCAADGIACWLLHERRQHACVRIPRQSSRPLIASQPFQPSQYFGLCSFRCSLSLPWLTRDNAAGANQPLSLCQQACLGVDIDACMPIAVFDGALDVADGTAFGVELPACKLTMAEEADDFFVFLLSDANLSQYGVTSNTMRQALMSEAKVRGTTPIAMYATDGTTMPIRLSGHDDAMRSLPPLRQVNPYAIFIAGELEAELIRRELPTGMCYICLDTKLLPNIFKEIFSRSVLNSKL